MLRAGQTKEPLCARKQCDVAPTMHPEFAIWLEMLFFCGSDFWSGADVILRRARAADEDFEVMHRLFGVYRKVSEELRESRASAGANPLAIAGRTARLGR